MCVCVYYYERERSQLASGLIDAAIAGGFHVALGMISLWWSVLLSCTAAGGWFSDPMLALTNHLVVDTVFL